MVAAAAAAAALSPLAVAEDINIDFGLPTEGPTDTYAAAGRAGTWNAIEGEHTPFFDPQIIYELVDVDGMPTDVTLYQFGGLALFDEDASGLDGDDERLMKDGLVTWSESLEICLWINGLDDGCYEVLMYGLRPGADAERTAMRHDFNPPTITVGGAWPGTHAEGVSYARHVVDVVDQFLGSHAGVGAPGAFGSGGVLNGMQIRRLSDADIDGDGTVGLGDVLVILAAWGPCTGDCDADLDGDGTVGLGDILEVLASWD